MLIYTNINDNFVHNDDNSSYNIIIFYLCNVL
jgi:hypothetical protein